MTVTGMSCAACSARVEKAVSKVPGVTSCSVSLLTNSMGVEGTASAAGDRKCSRRTAGYGAATRKARKKNRRRGEKQEEALKDHETPKLQKRLIASVRSFLAVLMYFSMGHMMWGWPVPACHERQSCGNGTVAAAFDRHHHGDQPEVLCERFYQPARTAHQIWIHWWHSAPEHRLDTVRMPCLP